MHAGCNTSQKEAIAALTALCEGFFDVRAVERCACVLRAEDLPRAASELLVHRNHMTVMLQRAWGEAVRLEVRSVRREAGMYARSIVLRPASRDLVVEVGIARIDLSAVDDAVREQILAARTPLGEVLIAHNVLRRIDPQHYYRFTAESPILQGFGAGPPDEAYGRVGAIHCNEREGVKLLEVVRTE